MHITKVFMTHYEMNMLIQVEPDQESIFVSTLKTFLAPFPRSPNSLGNACNFLLFALRILSLLAPFCPLYHFSCPFYLNQSTCPLKLHQIPFPTMSFCSCHLL